MKVVPKKHLGQHFLKDVQICKRIADAILINEPEQNVLEIGPGTGALTQFLIPKNFHWLPMKLTLNQSNICHFIILT